MILLRVFSGALNQQLIMQLAMYNLNTVSSKVSRIKVILNILKRFIYYVKCNAGL